MKIMVVYSSGLGSRCVGSITPLGDMFEKAFQLWASFLTIKLLCRLV